MTDHPYKNAAPYRRWRQGVAGVAPGTLDPVTHVPFRIAPADRIVTAGSCFAQHIARRLPDFGCSHFVTEPAHPLLPAAEAEAFGYGVYSARYGNIYTARQLLQLFRRAHGTMRPREDVWEDGGASIDPFRPAIQPGGFPTRREFALDRAQHFAAVRRAFADMDVLVFTLGLIEAWESAADGAVFPVCPGTVAGRFDPERHRLIVMTADEVVADFRAFLTEARALNPRFRVVLTVSPVPLMATALDRHVLEATVLAKATLRVAAEVIAQDPEVFYFPSYEMVTGAHARGAGFAADLRSVTESAVDHVMWVFARHMLEPRATMATDAATAPPPAPEQDFFARQQRAMEVVCEEEALDPD
jgi:hypothetical protein